MTSDRDTQIAFFSWLKESRGESLADKLVEVLDVSKDSAYRRLRGDTLLTFNEISKISQHFRISLDSYFQTNITSVTFQNRHITSDFSFRSYLHSILDNLKMIRKAKNHSLIFLAKDIPIFHYFQFPALSSFKIFFWLRTIIQDPEYMDKPYAGEVISDDLSQLATTIWHHYMNIDSVEIWSEETIHVTIRQINYYLESHVISAQVAMPIVEELLKMISHLRKEAEVGKKLAITGTPNPEINGDFSLYYNEVEIGDNTIFFEMEDKCMVFKTYNMLNTLQTSDANFCAATKKHIDQIINNSHVISKSGEKERARCFNYMNGRAQMLKKKLSFS